MTFQLKLNLNSLTQDSNHIKIDLLHILIFDKKYSQEKNIILGNNAVEQKGVKSNYFMEDLIKIFK